MKKVQIKKIYWFLMRVFPARLRKKLNLAFHCLAGEWDFAVNVYLFSAPFAALEEDEITRRLAGLDAKSIDVAKTYVRRCRNLEKIKGYPFSDGSKVLVNIASVREDIMCMPPASPELKSFQEKYGFKIGAEVLIYQHGLSFFKEQISHYIKNKIFIDAGACIGELVPPLLEYSPQKIYAFEPSKINAARFVKEMAKRRIPKEKAEIVTVALGAAEGFISFDDCGGSGQNLAVGEKNQCRVMPLDDFISEKSLSPVGLIKTDVEGMGLELLQGAINTIKRDRPVLSLAAYHNADELLGQYEFLKNQLEDYHFELLDLPPGSSFEVTLIGFPNKLFV